LFLLLSMLTYVKYVTCQKEVKSRWFISTLVLFVMALASKPMAVTFPAVLLLIDVYPLRRVKFISPLHHSIRQQPLIELLREKIPFILLSLLLALITIYAQQSAIGNVSESLYLRVLNAFNSVIFYLTKLLVPNNYATLYPFFVSEGDQINWQTYVPLIGVLTLTIAALFAWVRGRYAWLIAWLFYLVTLSPVLGLIQAGQQGAADRYAYFPTLSAYLLAGAGIMMLLSTFNSTKRILLLLSISLIILALAGKTRQQIRVWETDETLWLNTINLYPDNALAHLNLGVTYYNYGNYDEAIIYFSKAEKLQPNDTIALSWVGLTNLRLRRYTDAINAHVKLGAASESNPRINSDQYCIQYNIGWLYAQLGMTKESYELFGRINPNSEWGQDARIWLDWLKNANQTGLNNLTKDNLPGFCEKLLVSK
jgi:tetratricopeptide (TPR) repeat protein